ncbi:sensor histidine kinase [Actinoplanes sp. NEAU-A12]|uniref:histidine kinase n=1 Tax=Actinoplanes sandaracinus TaxID=3045177 RepID=A0ABT6WKK3_9ACTN|nr:sensor histidine kinase [Actinoplanes sandaracinus]MDI6100254.1 sensor histidine kinase [Actinoplanes sandaracinus]
MDFVALSRRLPAVPPRVADVLLTLVALAAQLAPFVSTEPSAGVGHWPWQMYLPPIAVSLPVLWRRHAPFLMLIACFAGSLTYNAFPLGPPQAIWYGALLGVFTVAERGRPWQRAVLLGGLAISAVTLSGSLATTTRGLVTNLAVYALGRALATHRTRIDLLAERAQHLERENALAVEVERGRIARDLHDILAHGLTVMVAQAQAGVADVRRNPQRAEASFDTITTVGREAMAQLRRVVAGTRPAGAPTVGPRLADLAELTERVSEAGPRVTVTQRGEPLLLAPDAEVAAYRIVQEALTNAVRHAGATAVGVRLSWHAGQLRVTVEDDGRGASGEPAGHGLIGMQERARACGGTVSAGPGAFGRGFRVDARLPAGVAAGWPA